MQEDYGHKYYGCKELKENIFYKNGFRLLWKFLNLAKFGVKVVEFTQIWGIIKKHNFVLKRPFI